MIYHLPRVWAATLSLCALFSGCLPVPPEVIDSGGQIVGGGRFILCEGLWRQDNSTLGFVADDGVVIRDVVSAFNPGLRLGDTGTDLHVRGDSIWVVVSTSRSIELFHRRTGKWLSRLRFDDLREPYAMAFVNDTVAVCTFLNDNTIAEFDARRMVARIPRVSVGPAPEGVAVIDGRIYVANSGLGDLRKGEPGAGTVSVLSTSDLATIDTIDGLPNVMSVIPDGQTGRVWCTYRHVVSAADSLGGIVLYDPVAKAITEHYRFRSLKSACLDPRTGAVYVLHASGVSKISGGLVSEVLAGRTADAWYTIAWDARVRQILIGNARGYVTDGELIVADTTGVIVGRYEVGINPGSIVVGD